MFSETMRFPCPSCKEIINDRMEECKYCGAPVDKDIAQMLGERQAEANQSYSDASYLKSAAVIMWGFLGISFIPLVPLVHWCFLVTFVIVIVLAIRWQLRFNDLNTSDPDYAKARRAKNLALVLWLAALPVYFVVQPLVEDAIRPKLW